MSDYVPGKSGWRALGLPIEGPAAGERTAGTVARDVPTYALDTTVAAARASLDGAPHGVVVDPGGLVLGLVRADALDAPDDTPVGAILQPGPRTIRPSLPATDLAQLLRDDHLDHILVTTAEGRLVGLARRDDLEDTRG